MKSAIIWNAGLSGRKEVREPKVRVSKILPARIRRQNPRVIGKEKRILIP